MFWHRLLIFALAAYPGWAMIVPKPVITGATNEQSCTVPQPQALFQPSDPQAFVWFQARQVGAGDQLRVDWVDPHGTVAMSSPYGDLPSAPVLCFVTRLPIAGFPPADQPGLWTVRVYVDDQLAAQSSFQIAGALSTGGPVLSRISRSQVPLGESEITLYGAGFRPESVVYLHQLTDGAWKLIGSLRPTAATAYQVTVGHRFQSAALYLVTAQNPDGRTSRSQSITVGLGGYKLPMVSGQPWELTQGNHGSFSHYGRNAYAFDLAPRLSHCVVAMKRGTVYAHDRGMGQTTQLKSFGNYITIDHGNGEYSHYAHLRSGTFAVTTGQIVEQGQALAIAGNSGYTLGDGGGYHVHVHVTQSFSISSPSVPFLFEDMRSFGPEGPPPGQPTPGMRGPLVSANTSILCDCRRRVDPGAPGGQTTISQSQWWHTLTTVKARSHELQVTLQWAGGANLDLHLMSPSGKHYGWYGTTNGYSGDQQNPEVFDVPDPEPGTWRVSVNARSAPGGPVPFQIRSMSR